MIICVQKRSHVLHHVSVLSFPKVPFPNVIYAYTSEIHVLQIGGSQELNEESLSLFTLLEPKLGEVLTGIHKL